MFTSKIQVAVVEEGELISGDLDEIWILPLDIQVIFDVLDDLSRAACCSQMVKATITELHAIYGSRLIRKDWSQVSFQCISCSKQLTILSMEDVNARYDLHKFHVYASRR